MYMYETKRRRKIHFKVIRFQFCVYFSLKAITTTTTIIMIMIIKKLADLHVCVRVRLFAFIIKNVSSLYFFVNKNKSFYN